MSSTMFGGYNRMYTDEMRRGGAENYSTIVKVRWRRSLMWSGLLGRRRGCRGSVTAYWLQLSSASRDSTTI